ncbi:MAG: DUF975 family protein [Clostridiales bacterium]|nr:DUF975 family protein [Clostridiales bacterium]
MEYHRAQLKRKARQAMKYQRPRPMLVTLLFTIIVSIGTQVVNGILRAASGGNDVTGMYAELVVRQQRDPLAAIQYMVVYFGPQRLALALFVGFVLAALIATLWADFMRTGYHKFCLAMVRGEQPQTDALFGHFPRWGGVLFTKLLAGVFRALWGLLLGAAMFGLIFITILLLDSPVMGMILILAIYIAYAVGLAWVTLRYAMVDFVIVDQGLTGMDAIWESKRLMRENGNTGRLFVLELSFIGWHLLEAGIIIACAMPMLLSAVRMGAYGPSAAGIPIETFGILAGLGLLLVAWLILAIFNLWLTPYITGAKALFYDCIRGVDSTPAGGYGWGPSGGWGQRQSGSGYNWTSGPTSGTGVGSGPRDGGDPPQQPPKSPKDDPWD